MENSWKTHGKLTENSRKTHRKLTENSRKTHRKLTENSRKTHRKLTGKLYKGLNTSNISQLNSKVCHTRVILANHPITSRIMFPTYIQDIL